jgi:LCP family protein required for cell wall assembly
MRTKRRNKKVRRLWISGIIAAVILILAGFAYIYFQNTETNIALFGVDGHESIMEGRSDSIMILSIKGNKIKLSSIMRDTYVDVEGHGMTKITKAYLFGGPELAVKTLNSNFNLNIKDYVAVNFSGLEKIVDSLGGVTIDIQPDEIQYINPYIKDISKIDNKTPLLITEAGPQNLNGCQALAYSRIRYTSGGDSIRTERHRTVLDEVFKKVKSDGIKKFPTIVSIILPYVRTNMSQTDMLKLGLISFTSNIGNLEQISFPLKGYWEERYINNEYFLVTDLKATGEQINNFIYNDQKPVDAPPAVTAVTAVPVFYNSMKVTWGATTGASGYVLYRATSKTGTYTAIKDTNSTSITDTKLYAGTTYYYKVKAYTKIGEKEVDSNYSSVVSAKPEPAIKTQPSVTAVPAFYNSIKVTWGAVEGASGYVLYRATSNTGNYTPVTSTTSTSITDAKLNNGKTYYYKVRAYAAVGASEVYSNYSSAVSAKLIPATQTQPSVTAVPDTKNSIKITWGAVEGASGYVLYRSTSSTGDYTPVTSTTSTNITDAKLYSGTTYYYKVRAYTTVGATEVYSNYSSVVNAKPM